MAKQNVFLFFLALICAVAIKFNVHEQRQVSERLVEAQVTYEQAAEGMISYDLQESVRILVRGSSVDVARLSPFSVQVRARIPSGRPGSREIVLEQSDVRFNVPGDFEALTLEPNRFTVQVEERFEVSVPIRILLSGEPAAGARASVPIPVPSLAVLSGPKSKVEKLTEITAVVDLDGHARTFEDSVSLTAPDAWVRVIRPAVVTVTVPMEEPSLSIDPDSIDMERLNAEAPAQQEETQP